MSESRHPDSASTANPSQNPSKRRATTSWHLTVFFYTATALVAMAAVLYRLEPFEPAYYPAHELSRHALTAPARNTRMRRGSEEVGKGHVAGPEDLVYDAESRVIYTGCWDGWIKRVTLKEPVVDTVVEDWVNTGGRPLGLASGKNGELIVADAKRGLLRVSQEGKIELLTDEVEGLKFKLTDGVDVAHDGTIYFTDASYKYSLHDFIYDILEGKPYGRLMSYNPVTNQTTLLTRDLYFPNGVAVSPDQTFVVFCETMLRRCRKYYIEGPKKGSLEKFIDDLPGTPDNIHYAGDGQYLIGLATSPTLASDLLVRYPFMRKVTAIIVKYVGRRPSIEKNAGVVAVDLEGKLTAHYYDPELAMISSGIKIRNHIYCGSLGYPFIIRLDVKQYPALPTT